MKQTPGIACPKVDCIGSIGGSERYEATLHIGSRDINRYVSHNVI